MKLSKVKSRLSNSLGMESPEVNQQPRNLTRTSIKTTRLIVVRRHGPICFLATLTYWNSATITTRLFAPHVSHHDMRGNF